MHVLPLGDGGSQKRSSESWSRLVLCGASPPDAGVIIQLLTDVSSVVSFPTPTKDRYPPPCISSSHFCLNCCNSVLTFRSLPVFVVVKRLRNVSPDVCARVVF